MFVPILYFSVQLFHRRHFTEKLHFRARQFNETCIEICNGYLITGILILFTILSAQAVSKTAKMTYTNFIKE